MFSDRSSTSRACAGGLHRFDPRPHLALRGFPGRLAQSLTLATGRFVEEILG